MNIIVVGGGIVGLSTAWALNARGHTVTVLEQGELPNTFNASTNPHRLIRYPYGHLDAYCGLVKDAFTAWDVLWESLGCSYYVQTGTLALSRDLGDWVEQSRQGLERLGVAHEILEAAQVSEHHGAISANGIRWALKLDTGGVLLSDRIGLALVQYLKQCGVDLRTQSTVQNIDIIAHTVMLADGSQLKADALVIAAGAHVTKLIPALASRTHPNRKVNLYLKPPAALSKAWANAPIIVDLGGEMAGVLIPPVADTNIRFGAGILDKPVEAGHETQVLALEEASMFELLHDTLLDFDGYRTVGSMSCHHVSTPDEQFIFEAVAERSWVVSGCSGHMYKFGPLLGQILARALLNEAGSERLIGMTNKIAEQTFKI